MFARFSPAKYVSHLKEIPVPGYGQIAITRYVSGNIQYGGARRGEALRRALIGFEGNEADRARLGRAAARQVCSGQGMPHHIAWLMTKVMQHRDRLVTLPDFTEPLTKGNPLQALCDEGVIGMDCNGFVGTYLAAAGVDPHFNGSPPVEFLQRFPLIDSLDEVRPLCVIVLTNYAHVQIIDAVVDRSPGRVVVDICQSTHSSHARGPQVNRRLSIRLGRGDFAPVDDIRAQRSQLSRENAAHEAHASGLWAEFIAANPQGTERAYLAWLRTRLMLRGQTEGVAYRHHGSIFTLESGGHPRNEVGGAVFIGAMPRLQGAQ